MEGIFYALMAAFALGLWTVFHDQAASHIGNLLGAILVSLTAVLLGAAIFLIQRTPVQFTGRGILYVVLAGAAALAIDFFALKAYSSGTDVSVAGPVIIGGSIAVASLLGFLMGEPVTAKKFLGAVLVVAGVVLLS